MLAIIGTLRYLGRYFRTEGVAEYKAKHLTEKCTDKNNFALTHPLVELVVFLHGSLDRSTGLNRS